MFEIVPGRLRVGRDGKLAGPASLSYNDPWPVANGTPGGGSPQMMGVVMHTMVGNLESCISWFNDPASQVSAFFGIGQDGHIHQFGPVGADWMAWAQGAGNAKWYSIEHADDGDPANPLTQNQIEASAQLLECLSTFAGFPLQVTDNVNIPGYGWHGMGGEAWGNHPACPGDVRKAQRPAIIGLAGRLRAAAEIKGIVVTPDLLARKVVSHDAGQTWATERASLLV